MKKNDLEIVIETLNDLKLISNKLDYNTSTAINKRLMTIIPLLEKEYDRLDTEKIKINSPKIMLVSTQDIEDTSMSLTDFVNNLMEDLIEKGYKIIDFGVATSTPTMIMYIKYTD